MRCSIRISLFVFILLFSFCSYGQNTLPKLEAAMLSSSERFDSDRSEWKEIEKERTVFSSTYLTPDHSTIVHYSELPLNYTKNGKLVPVNVEPHTTADGKLIADDQPLPVAVNASGAISTGLDNATGITYSKNVIINGQGIHQNNFELNGPKAIMKDVLPGVDKTFEFRYNAVEYSYVFNHPIQASGTDLVIEEEFEIPVSARLELDPEVGRKDGNGWIGPMSITIGTGEEIGTVRAAFAYDANKKTCPARYEFEERNGKKIMKLILPSSWINDPARLYPVVLDPLVTGPTTTWAGSYIPSCLAPMNHADSILITIPAQITVTGFYVSSSYYADPFSTAVMSDGQMFFSTTCNQSTTFTVAPPAGSTAGTGYLSAYDLRNPLLCCFPQSCSSQSFYLLMHLYRTAGGSGCGTTHIYHDPFGGYPFQAYIQGHTVESYGSQWNVSPSPLCSNVCTVTGTVYMKYGVPPYTITHAWNPGTFTAGAAAGCSFSATSKVLTLTIPGCPWICDTISYLSVPPAVVTDGCGNSITAIPPDVISIKKTPDATATPNPATVCSGVPFTINLSSCVPTATYAWTGPSPGTGTSITGTITNTGTSVTTDHYTVTASDNGCNSNPLDVVINTDPTPNAGFTIPSPVIINIPATFTDNTSSIGGTVNAWYWTFGDGSSSILQNPVHSWATPGIYQVCLSMQTTSGCTDTICQDVTVIPAELVLPNVITPNGDNQNDILYFKYLEFFGNNNLKVYDRWGKIIYQKTNYANDWNAKDCSDGTYYFVLETAEKTYPGYVQIIHK